MAPTPPIERCLRCGQPITRSNQTCTYLGVRSACTTGKEANLLRIPIDGKVLLLRAGGGMGVPQPEDPYA